MRRHDTGRVNFNEFNLQSKQVVAHKDILYSLEVHSISRLLLKIKIQIVSWPLENEFIW